MQRCRVHWTGFTGSPGVNTFYYTQPTDPAPALGTLYGAMVALFPNVVTWSFDSSGDLVDDATGALTGTWTGTAQADVQGTNSSSEWSGASGTMIRWTTASVINRRHLIGKTFLVPLSADRYDNGSIQSGTLGTIRAAVATYLGSTPGTNQLVWHRPKTPAAGSSHPVTGAIVPDLAVVLRSRRS